ncbi:MAG TPA: F0F1 ATP synthase subunit B [Candidatus Methylomirabilis sp.]|nr:F0F1 ATP synthase subunit B [Candidatus Methylomirabilis sp.]
MGRSWTVMVGVLLVVLAWGPPELLAAAAAEGVAEHKPGIINIDKTLLLQLVNFLILVAILYKFLFKPLTAFMAQRADGIRRSLSEAEEARQAAARTMEEYSARLVAAQKESEAVRARMEQEVAGERQRLLKESREEATRLLEAARVQIAQEVKKAKAALREEAASLSVAAAEKLLGRTLTEADHRRLVEQAIRDVGGEN